MGDKLVEVDTPMALGSSSSKLEAIMKLFDEIS